jgi:hypothetical protein
VDVNDQVQAADVGVPGAALREEIARWLAGLRVEIQCLDLKTVGAPDWKEYASGPLKLISGVCCTR